MPCSIFSYDFPKTRKLPKIFLRSFKSVGPGTCTRLSIWKYLKVFKYFTHGICPNTGYILVILLKCALQFNLLFLLVRELKRHLLSVDASVCGLSRRLSFYLSVRSFSKRFFSCSSCQNKLIFEQNVLLSVLSKWSLRIVDSGGTTMTATNNDGQIHNGHNHDCTKSKPTARPTGCTQ